MLNARVEKNCTEKSMLSGLKKGAFVSRSSPGLKLCML